MEKNKITLLAIILFFILLIILRMFQVEIGANRNLLREIEKVQEIQKKTQNNIDNFLREHKRMRKYFK